MAGTTPVREASFKVRAAAFPACAWYEFRKTLKARRSSRTKRNPSGPPWERIEGQGFTLWISDGCLYDGRTSPPTWEIRLEALAPLNPAGQRYWREVCEGIERFIRESGLASVDSASEARSSTAATESAAERGAALDRPRD